MVGILGSGMSALAQYLAWSGLRVSGSDRSLGSTSTAGLAEKLSLSGCRLYEQNGAGVTTALDAVCVSTAIEPDNPDISAALRLSIPVVHRSDVLAAVVDSRSTIAIAGTSGKSTVTAMIFEFLTFCGKSPSLISGASLLRLERESLVGNAFFGASDLLVVEADESDGSLVKYRPEIAVFLNISKDHKPVEEVKTLFVRLAGQSRISLRNADDPQLGDLETTHTFSLQSPSGFRPDSFSHGQDGGQLTFKGTTCRLPVPGLHNLSNCCAALAVSGLLGCELSELCRATASFEGVARRFSISQMRQGFVIIDDFAHNPEKIRAAVTSARSISPRIFALYQPHGFGPTRFLREEYRELFSTIFNKGDTLYLLPIYYAGGTAVKDISAADLKNDIGDVPFTVRAPSNRDDCLPELIRNVRPGDCILVMGARDPSLSGFVKKIIDLFRD